MSEYFQLDYNSIKEILHDCSKTLDSSNNYVGTDDLIIQFIDNLLEENQELKEKIETYEDPEDLTLMFMYCDEKAKDKIRELKKQLEEIDYTVIPNCEIKQVIDKYKNQQKEFIDWLEENWNTTQDIWYIKILNKYKEIIGAEK